MRIAFISQYFFPEQFSNNAIAAELTRRGHSVHVVCGVPNYGHAGFFEGYSNTKRRAETWNGVTIDRAWTIARGRSLARLAANFLTYPVTGSWLALRRMKPRPDVSFVSLVSPIFQAIPGLVLRWTAGVPCVYWVQDIWPESVTITLGLRSPLITRPLAWLCGWIYRRADLVLVQSEAFPPMLARFGVPPERIRVLPNTAPDSFRPIAAEDAPDEGELVRQGGFRVMFAGNIGESQDFDTVIAAADILRAREDLCWVIIGSGRDQARVEAEIHKRGLGTRFQFLGRHPEDRMPRFFAHADAMMVSLKDAPIFALTVPYKVQCYMACGKPIVASLNGEGARVVREAGVGFAADAGQPENLAAAVAAMMALSAAERAALGKNAREFFLRKYAQPVVYGMLETWLHEAAALPGAAPAFSPDRTTRP